VDGSAEAASQQMAPSDKGTCPLIARIGFTVAQAPCLLGISFKPDYIAYVHFFR
jgi:hypothetical protein